MKPNLIVLILAAACLFSCSKDGDNNTSNPIVGTWFAAELQIDDATASDEAKNSRDALNFLTARQCYVIKFVFNQDLSVTAENSVNYIEVTTTSTGIDIPCPSQKDTDSSTYTYVGTTLSIVDSSGNTVTTTATVDGNTLTVDASGLDIPFFNDSGQLIFQRQ